MRNLLFGICLFFIASPINIAFAGSIEDRLLKLEEKVKTIEGQLLKTKKILLGFNGLRLYFYDGDMEFDSASRGRAPLLMKTLRAKEEFLILKEETFETRDQRAYFTNYLVKDVEANKYYLVTNSKVTKFKVFEIIE